MSVPAALNLNPVIERFGIQDSALNDDERPWIKHNKVPDTYWQPVRFDVRNGAWTFIVHIQKPGALGRHQHHGQVFAYVIEGSWWLTATIAFLSAAFTTAMTLVAPVEARDHNLRRANE
jgi:hypothetical protein